MEEKKLIAPIQTMVNVYVYNEIEYCLVDFYVDKNNEKCFNYTINKFDCIKFKIKKFVPKTFFKKGYAIISVNIPIKNYKSCIDCFEKGITHDIDSNYKGNKNTKKSLIFVAIVVLSGSIFAYLIYRQIKIRKRKQQINSNVSAADNFFKKQFKKVTGFFKRNKKTT